MKIFVYEFVTGGGFFSAGQSWPPPDSLCREGRAMLSALASDFAELAGTHVAVLRDARFEMEVAANPRIRTVQVDSAEQHRNEFTKLAAWAEWTVVIAPEIDGALSECCGWVATAGGRLLGPSAAALAIASDKQRTAEWLMQRDIPMPPGMLWEAGFKVPVDFRFPAVLKPCDGAGSCGVQFLPDRNVARITDGSDRWRLESFCPGMPASVALLCGPQEVVALSPTRQLLRGDDMRDGEVCEGERFVYLGGELPLAEPLAVRAVRLARAAILSLPEPLGYLGVDLVLGEDPSGSDDVVIEINPRLTTSYVGLRAAARGNLAEAMLAIAAGQRFALCSGGSAVEFTTLKTGVVRFDSSGNVYLTTKVQPT